MGFSKVWNDKNKKPKKAYELPRKNANIQSELDKFKNSGVKNNNNIIKTGGDF